MDAVSPRPAASDTRGAAAWHVGVCGTFDVRNYGDILFPMIAEHALSRRLGSVGWKRFSYLARKPPAWPYAVAPLTEMPAAVADLDGLLIGGGDLIRFDKDVAPGYRSPSAGVHHPTGYWLGPALMALNAGCPVLWNAPGVCGEIPVWAEPLMALAVGHSDYVSVRDAASRDKLARFAGAGGITVVPDSCFAIGEMLAQHDRTAALARAREQCGLDGDYVVLQATGDLEAFLRMRRAQPERFRGLKILALPVGPALGDGEAALGDLGFDIVRLPEWPEPLLLAALVGNAVAAVGVSLHLAITALAMGVPVFRPREIGWGKFAVLDSFETVHGFDRADPIDPDWFFDRVGKAAPEAAVRLAVAALDSHWDRIAAIIAADRGHGARLAATGQMWAGLPGRLEAVAAAEAAARAADRETVLAAAVEIPALRGLVEGQSEHLRLLEASLAASRAEAQETKDAMDRNIEALNRTLASKEAVLASKDAIISQHDTVLAERQQHIANFSAALIADRDAARAGNRELTEALSARTQEIATLKRSLAEHRADLAANAELLIARDRALDEQRGLVAAHDQRVEALEAALARAEDELAVRSAREVSLQTQLVEKAADLVALGHTHTQQQASLAERDRQIASLQAGLAEGKTRIVSLAAELAQSRDAASEAAAHVAALQQSTSWRATAPLRRLGGLRSRQAAAAEAGVLQVDRFRQERVAQHPYRWAFVDRIFSTADAAMLAATYPHDKFKTVKGFDGEKGYEYEARALIDMGRTTPTHAQTLSPVWQRLARDLLSPGYRAAMAELTAEPDLLTAPMEAYVCHFGQGAWLGPHLDLKDKIVTHVLYFNESWDPQLGGCLRILGSADMSDLVAEVQPVVGNSSVLVRAENSWHAVSRVVDGCRESRRSMNVIFYRPGAVSTMWPPGDRTPLHDYRPG